MNNSLIKKYLKLLILSFLLILFVSTTLINNTLLNEKYHLNKMNKNYYNKLNEEIYESIKLETMSSGFDEKIINNFYSTKDIKNDVLEYMNYIFDKSNEKLDLSNIKNNTVNSVNKYIKDNNITEFDDVSINAYVNAVVDIYNEKITVMNIPKILKNRISKLHKILFIFDIILLLVIAIFMLLNRKNIFEYIFIPVNTLSIIYIFTSIMINLKIDIKHLLVITYSISDYIRLILNNISNTLLITGIVLLILSIFFNMLYELKIVKK